MLTRFVWLLLLMGVVPTVKAGSVQGTFGSGVLGVLWGTSLTDVVGVYPQGDHVFAVTPGCRAYWVKDGQMFLGIPRERSGVLFGFDKQNHVAIASVAFEFERKDQLRTTLTGLLGVPSLDARSTQKAQYGWRSADGMAATVTEFGDGPQRLVWLTVSMPGYKAVKDGC